MTLTSGQTLSAPAKGVYTNATIAGTVFTDQNVNGVKDLTENGVLGKTVYNDANDNGVRDGVELFATTAADGTYTLSLPPGVAHIRTVLTGADVCTGPSPCRYDLTLTSGTPFPANDFGIYTPSTVTGTVYADTDGNGTKAAGEAGLAPRTVFADYDADGVIDGGEPSTTAIVGGSFTLTGVRPGTATIRTVTTGAEACTTPAACAVAHVFESASSFAQDFGIWLPATVAGTVYDDSNASGSRAISEPGLGGRTVFDDVNNNGLRDPLEAQTTTALDGTYSLPGLAPGPHDIRASLPAGYTPTEPAGGAAHVLTLTSSQIAAARDFGGYQDATVRGHLYEDVDGDHVHQAGEPPIAGQAVRLYAADGTTLLKSTTTDPAGLYAFTGLMPATYVVKLALSGYVCSSPAPCEQTLFVASGETSPGQDFTAYRTATVTGTVYTDSDNDATQDGGEPLEPGIVVYADLNADGDRDGVEPSTVTAAGGTYSLAGLAPGSVHIRADLAAGFACSTPSGCDHAVTLTSNETKTGRDFGIVQGSTATGTVATDDDADGTVDAGEPRLAGWTVSVDLDGDGQPDLGEPADDTDAGGVYTIANIPPGTRTLRVAAPAGWTCSSPCSRSVPLTSGATTSGLDFALYEPVTISGTVFEDENGDGTRNGSDAPIAGRTVYLDLDADDVQDGSEPTATTGAGGAYGFPARAPGTYRVATAAPAGFTCTVCAAVRTLTSGQSATANLGVYAAASVAGTVYDDLDADGTQDLGEPGLSGRQVYLDLDGDAAYDGGEPTTTTVAGGAYTLPGIVPTSGTLRAVLPGGYVKTQPGSPGYALTLTSSDAVTGRDFGGYEPASISGHVIDDLNGNGVDDPGEPGKMGWIVYLDTDGDGAQDGTEPTATTNASGDYAFAGLVPATYRVRPAITAGFTCTKPAVCVYVDALVSGEDATARDFALVEAARASGTVYRDSDADGGRDVGEPGLDNQTVYVDYDGDNVRDSDEPFTATAANGTYTLTGVSPGTFRLRWDAAAGEHVSEPAAGSYLVTFTSGATVPARDFGGWRDASISGVQFEDVDGDGTRDGGDGGLGGRTIYIDADGDDALGASEVRTTTAPDGTYGFPGLLPGAYAIRAVVPAGSTCSAPTGCEHAFTLTSGESAGGRDFGSYADGTVAGRVYGDADADGTRDGDENGLPGRTVYLDLDGDDTHDLDGADARHGRLWRLRLRRPRARRLHRPAGRRDRRALHGRLLRERHAELGSDRRARHRRVGAGDGRRQRLRRRERQRHRRPRRRSARRREGLRRPERQRRLRRR